MPPRKLAALPFSSTRSPLLSQSASNFAGVGLALASLLTFAAPSAAHERAKAKAVLVPAEGATLRLTVELHRADVEELSGTDLSAPGDPRTQAATAGAAGWFSLSRGGRPCPTRVEVLRPSGTEGARLVLSAACALDDDRVVLSSSLARDGFLEILVEVARGADLTVRGLDGGTLVVEAAADGGPGSADPRPPSELVVLSGGQPQAEISLSVPTTGSQLARFWWLGIEHIVFGWDHLAFLLALLLGCATLTRVLWVATGFTLAHSVTLVLGALGVVPFSPDVIEPLIAISIGVVAVAGLVALEQGRLSFPGADPATSPSSPRELGFAIGFGLLHGLGFASMLLEVLTDAGSIVVPLLGFNLGVETGQLVLVALVFPLLANLGRWRHGRWAFRAAFALLVALSLGWGIERVF